MLVGSLIENGHAMPAEARGALAAALALAGIAQARAAAVLFLLDPHSVVRRAVAAALAQVATSLIADRHSTADRDTQLAARE